LPLEPDHRPATPAAPALDHLEFLIAGPEPGAGREPASVVARRLDEERAVEPVRLADAPDDDAAHVPSKWRAASSAVIATRRFSATNSAPAGQPLASISAIARSMSNGVCRNEGSPSSTSVQYAATSPSYGIPTE